MRGRLLGATAASLTVLVVTAGCSLFGSGFPHRTTIEGTSLVSDQVSQLLGVAEQRSQSLVHTTHAATDDTPRCFVSFYSKKKHTARPALRCGPVKVFGGSNGANWFHIGLTQGEDRPGSLRLEDPGSGEQTPKPLTGGEVLARPDGKDPGSSKNIKTPQPPAAAAGLVKPVGQAPTTGMKPPAQSGLLIGPDFATRLSRTSTSPTFGVGSAARSAAAGQEFVVAQLQSVRQPTVALNTTEDPSNGSQANGEDQDEGAYPYDQSEDAQLTTTVVVGDTRHNVDLSQAGALVVSVPKGQTPYLEVGDRGATQKLDLRTGAHSGDTRFSPLYRKSNVVTVNKSYNGKYGSEDDFDNASFSVTVDRATLTPYDPSNGLAPASKVWLALNLSDPDGNGNLTPSTFMLDAPGVKSSAPKLPKDQEDVTYTDRVLWAVPTDFSSGTVTIQGKGKTDGILSDAKKFAFKAKTTLKINIPSG